MEEGKWASVSGRLKEDGPKWTIENGRSKVDCGKKAVKSGRSKVDDGKWAAESSSFQHNRYRPAPKNHNYLEKLF